MVEITEMQPAHWNQVQEIYRQGIATGNATFQTSLPDWEEWNRTHLEAPRLTATEANRVLGWAALTPVSGRCVYAGVAEVSIYMADESRGKGIGTKLLSALVDGSEANGIWTLQAGIFPDNHASINLHKQCGFRQVGAREKLGKLNGAWRDVLLFERRSPTVGLS